MKERNIILSSGSIESKIFTIRDTQVMLDYDLAEVYQVKTKALNQAVKRNIDRFPALFRFQLTTEEKNYLVTNCDRLTGLKHSTINPYVFTEQGVAMLSSVLQSTIAVKLSVQIMQAFVEMRRLLSKNGTLFQRIERVEHKLTESDLKFEQIFRTLEKKEEIPSDGIFFNGQVFDAYKFVSDLVKKANKTIKIIDNYVDDTVLLLLSKKKKNVECIIFSENISDQLKLDADKFNKQYPIIRLVKFNKSHDRFLIIDNTDVYHIGASLKDLGKRWFAFSKLDQASVTIIDKLKGLL